MQKSERAGNGARDPFAHAPRALLSVLLASTAFLPVSLVATGTALADCTTAGGVTTCDTNAPNPFTSTVGTGPGDNGRTVNVQDDAEIETDNANAISLGNNAQITVSDGAFVRNNSTNASGLYGTGGNTVEFGSNGTILIEEGGQILSQGTQTSGEAINVHGEGNRIENHGLIQAENAAAIWFENDVIGVKNEVVNYGIIRTKSNGGDANAFGSSATAGIIFKNQTGAEVHGHLQFGSGDDELEFFADSLVAGNINGGGGTDSLTLNGAAGSDDELTGAISNFETLVKTGEGKWTASGSLSGFTDVTVEQGTLALTGNNTGFQGSIVVDPLGILESRARSLPLSAGGPPDVTNNGLVRFAQPVSGTYTGQIVGTGVVKKTGAGTLTLAPTAAAGNTYSGGTIFTEGAIAVSADNALGAETGSLTFNGGTLRFNAEFDLAETRAITLEDDGGTFDTQGFTSTVTQGITGTGGLTKTGSGLLFLNGNNTYGGDTLVEAGTLVVGDADHTGAALSGGGDVQVDSGAVFGGYGSTAGNVENEGTIAVANALTALSGGPTGTFTIGGGLQNSGQVLLGGPQVGNVLSVGGDYVGDGGEIHLDTVLGDDSSPTDMLVLNGGTASGNTALFVTNAGGAGALTTNDGIRVVDAINGATTEADAFTLGNYLAAGAYEYRLFHGGRVTTGGEPDDQDWYLRSHLIGQDVPIYREEVPLYTALPSLASLYGFALLDTLHERIGETFMRPATRVGATGGSAVSGAWGRVFGVFGERDNVDDGEDLAGDGPGFDYTFGAVQAGLDLYRAERGDGGQDRAGAYLGVGHISSDVDAQFGGKAGDADMEAYTLGLYWTHFGAQGWYLDAVAQGTFYDGRAKSTQGQQLDSDGWGVIASLEGGYPIGLGDGLVLEPQAQLAYQVVDMEDGKDDFGRVSFEKAKALFGRLGARLARTWQTNEGDRPLPATAWLRANVWSQFLDDPKTTFATLDGDHPVSVNSPLSGTWGEIGIGGSAFVSETVSLFTMANYNHSLDDSGHEAWDVKAGLTVTW